MAQNSNTAPTSRESRMARSFPYPWLPKPREDCIGLVRDYSNRSTLGHKQLDDVWRKTPYSGQEYKDIPMTVNNSVQPRTSVYFVDPKKMSATMHSIVKNLPEKTTSITNRIEASNWQKKSDDLSVGMNADDGMGIRVLVGELGGRKTLGALGVLGSSLRQILQEYYFELYLILASQRWILELVWPERNTGAFSCHEQLLSYSVQNFFGVDSAEVAGEATGVVFWLVSDGSSGLNSSNIASLLAGDCSEFECSLLEEESATSEVILATLTMLFSRSANSSIAEGGFMLSRCELQLLDMLALSAKFSRLPFKLLPNARRTIIPAGRDFFLVCLQSILKPLVLFRVCWGGNEEELARSLPSKLSTLSSCPDKLVVREIRLPIIDGGFMASKSRLVMLSISSEKRGKLFPERSWRAFPSAMSSSTSAATSVMMVVTTATDGSIPFFGIPSVL
uniref:Uncharacterized protein n=1 Tax=Timema genevievae TaxID=629358 RepID=A0A7R9JWH4_TIMGE|nr:unnamed protein product [Timema genevievae]